MNTDGINRFENPLNVTDDDTFDVEPGNSPTQGAGKDATADAAADDDDDDDISLIKTMTLALTFQGVGDWVVQVYTISGFLLALSLLTLMDISWPTGWSLMFEWLNFIVVPVKHIPFDALLDDIELGNFMNFLCVILIHPVLLAYALYRYQFFSSVDAKTKWEDYAKKSFKLPTILLILLWLVPPIVVRTHHMLLDDEDEIDASRADWQVWLYGERDGSGSQAEQLMPHAANSFFVLWLWLVGLLVLPFLLYRHATRFNYNIALVRKTPVSRFFGAWAQAEGSVIAYLFIFLHLSSIVASIEIAFTCGPDSDCFAHHRGLGLMSFVLACVLGPIYAVGLPLVLKLVSKSFLERLEGYDSTGILDPEHFSPAGRANFASSKARKAKEAERMRQLSVVVQLDVAQGQLDAFRGPPMLQVVTPFHPHQYWMRPVMMLDKVFLAFFIVGFENKSGGDVANFTEDVQLLGAIFAASLSLLVFVLLRPMIDSNEALTEVLCRASVIGIIVIGAINFYSSSIVWDLVLIVVTLGTIATLALMFGPLKIQGVLKAVWSRFQADKEAAGLTESWVKSQAMAKVMRLNDADVGDFNAQQQGWLVIHHGASLAKPKAQLKSIRIGRKTLPTQVAYGSKDLDFQDAEVDADNLWVFPTLLNWWLNTPGGASMSAVNMLTQAVPTEVTRLSSTNCGQLLIDTFQNHSSLLTLLGIPDGAEAAMILDLKNKNMDCGVAMILGAELGSGSLPKPRNGRNVRTLQMSNNPLILIESSTGKSDITGFENICSNADSLKEWDLVGCRLTSDAVKSMAALVKWSQLTKLTIDSTGHKQEEKQLSYTLQAKDAQVDLASKQLGPCDAKLIVTWLAKDNVDAKGVILTNNRLGIEGGKHIVEFLENQDKLETITISQQLPLKEALKQPKLDFSKGGVDDDGSQCIIAWWLQSPVAATLEDLDLTNNKLGLNGIRALVEMKNKPQSLKRMTVSVGPRNTKLTIFDDAVSKLNLRRQNLEQHDVSVVFVCVPTLPSLVSVDLFKNEIPDNGIGQLKKDLAAYPKIRSICGFDQEVPFVDWSKQELNAADCELITVELELPGGFLSEVSMVNLANNPDIAQGISSVLTALKDKPVTSLNLSGCKLPGTINSQIADMVAQASGTAFSKNIVSLTLDSSGSDRAQVFHLNANDTVLDVSKRNLGPDDANLVGAWLEKSSVKERLQTVKMHSNPSIGTGNRRGVLHLVDSMQDIPLTALDATGCGIENAAAEFSKLLFAGSSKFSESISSITIDCAGGAGAYTLDSESEVIDLNKKSLGVADVKLIAGWMKKKKVRATAKSLLMSQNPGIIGEHGKTDISGFRDLCSNINFLLQWDLSECNTDTELTLLLAREIEWSKCGLTELSIDSTGDLSGRTEAYESEAVQRQAQKAYKLDARSKTIDIAGKNIGSADLELLAAWLGHRGTGFKQPVFAMVNAIKMANNPLVGIAGTEVDGVVAMCAAINQANSWDLSGCKAMTAEVTNVLLQKIDWEQCALQELKLDSTGIPNSAKGYQLTKIGKKDLGIQLDVSNKNLGYADAMLITKWISSMPGGLTKVVLGGNPALVGEVDQLGSLLQYDISRTQFKDLCTALSSALAEKVEALDVSGCGIGPKALVHVSKLIGGSNRVFGSLKVSSTADVANPCTYELKPNDKSYELRAKCLGVADIELLAEWTKNPAFRKVLTKIDLAQNPAVGAIAGTKSGDSKINALLTNMLGISLVKLDLSGCNLRPNQLSALAPTESVEIIGVPWRFKDTKFKRAIKQLTLTSTGDGENEGNRKTYTLKAEPSQVKIDLNGMFLGSEDLCVLGMWLTKPDVISVVEEIDLSGCPITNSRRQLRPSTNSRSVDFGQDREEQPNNGTSSNAWSRDALDTNLDGLQAVCSSLAVYKYGGKQKKVSKTLTMRDSGVGNKGCQVLAKLITDCGALLGIDISQNTFDIAGARAIGSVVKRAHANHQSLHWVKLGSAETVTIPVSKKKIKTLDLSKAALSAPIGPIEAAVLGGALLTMPSIKELDLSGQPLVLLGEKEQTSGLEDILSSLKDNGSVSILTLANCGLQERSEQALAHFLQNNGVVHTVNVLGNPFKQGIKNLVAVYKLQENIQTLCGFPKGTKEVNWAGAGRTLRDLDFLEMEMTPHAKGVDGRRRALQHLQLLDLSGEQNFGGKDFEKAVKAVRKQAAMYRPYIWQRKTFYKGVSVIPEDPKRRHDQHHADVQSLFSSDSEEEGDAKPQQRQQQVEEESDEYYDSSDENDDDGEVRARSACLRTHLSDQPLLAFDLRVVDAKCFRGESRRESRRESPMTTTSRAAL